MQAMTARQKEVLPLSLGPLTSVTRPIHRPPWRKRSSRGMPVGTVSSMATAFFAVSTRPPSEESSKDFTMRPTMSSGASPAAFAAATFLAGLLATGLLEGDGFDLGSAAAAHHDHALGVLALGRRDAAPALRLAAHEQLT